MRLPQTKTALVLPLLAAAAIAGCYPKAGAAPGSVSPAAVEWAAAKWPGETEASLTAGKDLFMAKCNNCHAYPDLVAIDEEDWPSIVKRMTGKADLPEDKADPILHYVLATRSEQAKSQPAKQ
jgi:cytochrome c5